MVSTSPCNVRGAHGFTFQGGTSTGKVTNDFCDIRDAVPEATVGFGTSLLLFPYCDQESPWQTSFRGLVTYTIPKIDVNLSSVFQDKPNICDRPARLAGCHLHAHAGGRRRGGSADWPAADVGRLPPGQPGCAGRSLWRPHPPVGLRRQEVLPLWRPAGDGRPGYLQHHEQQRDRLRDRLCRAVRWAKVTSLVRNRIIEICYCEGRIVAKGDVLARLDDRSRERARRVPSARSSQSARWSA